MKNKFKNNEKGFALPLALLLLVVMTIMGLTLVTITSNEHKANTEKDSNQATKIINHENGIFGNIQNFDDKYYRETFFASVHTRNLAKHVAITEQTGTSISESSTYNK